MRDRKTYNLSQRALMSPGAGEAEGGRIPPAGGDLCVCRPPPFRRELADEVRRRRASWANTPESPRQLFGDSFVPPRSLCLAVSAWSDGARRRGAQAAGLLGDAGISDAVAWRFVCGRAADIGHCVQPASRPSSRPPLLPPRDLAQRPSPFCAEESRGEVGVPLATQDKSRRHGNRSDQDSGAPRPQDRGRWTTSVAVESDDHRCGRSAVPAQVTNSSLHRSVFPLSSRSLHLAPNFSVQSS
jgi:hypothetical protein